MEKKKKGDTQPKKREGRGKGKQTGAERGIEAKTGEREWQGRPINFFDSLGRKKKIAERRPGRSVKLKKANEITKKGKRENLGKNRTSHREKLCEENANALLTAGGLEMKGKKERTRKEINLCFLKKGGFSKRSLASRT